MARRGYTKKSVHHKRKMTIPLAVVAGFIPGVMDVVNNGRDSGWNTNRDGAISVLLRDFIGIQTTASAQAYTGGKSWNSFALGHGLYPAVIGFVAHWGANKLGVNRMLSNMGVPLVRI